MMRIEDKLTPMIEGKDWEKVFTYRNMRPFKGCSVLAREENSCALGIVLGGR